MAVLTLSVEEVEFGISEIRKKKFEKEFGRRMGKRMEEVEFRSKLR